MTKIHRQALLEYSCEQVFELISDIERYPEFMPGCVGSEVLRKEANVVEARLDLRKAGVRQSFSTRNTQTPPTRIDMQLLSGPFQSLEGFWQISEIGDHGCKITLDLDFETGKSLLMRAAGSLFEETANRLVDAVTERAKQLYGTT